MEGETASTIVEIDLPLGNLCYHVHSDSAIKQSAMPHMGFFVHFSY